LRRVPKTPVAAQDEKHDKGQASSSVMPLFSTRIARIVLQGGITLQSKISTGCPKIQDQIPNYFPDLISAPGIPPEMKPYTEAGSSCSLLGDLAGGHALTKRIVI